MSSAPQAGTGGELLRLMPESASNWAPGVDALFLSLTVFSTVVAVGICLTMIGFAVRYRRGSTVDRTRGGGRTTLYEVTWITIPAIIAFGMFWWGARGFVAMHRPPAGTYTVYVLGKQWMWKVLHPGGRQEINALHVPLGQPVRVLLVSQDVIHSFFVPAFRVKQDALPDRYTSVWFEATRVGVYDLFCTEYCGVGHSRMIGKVTVLEPADFEAWLDPGAARGPVAGTPGAPDAPLDLAGAGPFHRFGCNACHLPGAAVRAPRLDGLYGSEVRLANGTTVLADEQYLRESILRPNEKITAGYPAPSLMPSYEGQIGEEELAELIEFIKSLEHGWGEER